MFDNQNGEAVPSNGLIQPGTSAVTEAMLDIGFVGGGNIARFHAKRLVELGENVRAVADIDADAGEAFADAFGATETYESYRRMIDESDLDVVVVAVPNSLHADCAITALEADLDVFVEKPLADTYAAAEKVAAAAKESDGRVMVGFVKAFSAEFEDAKERVADGELGTVYDVEAKYIRRRGIPQLGGWFTRKEIAGGGVLIDTGVHVLHLALSILGFPEIETVSASTDSKFGTKDDYTYLNMWGGSPRDDGVFDVEDHARAFIRTVDGTTIDLHAAWACNDESEQRLAFRGDDAGLVTTIDGGETDVQLYSTDRDALSDVELGFSDDDGFVKEWTYFTDVVRGAREHTRNTLEEGLAVQRLIESIYESAETGREVPVEAITPTR